MMQTKTSVVKQNNKRWKIKTVEGGTKEKGNDHQEENINGEMLCCFKHCFFCQLSIRHKDIFSSQKLLENYEGAALNAKVGLQNSQVENGMDYGVSVEVPGNSTKDYNYESEYITDTTQLFNHCKGQQQWKRYSLSTHTCLI